MSRGRKLFRLPTIVAALLVTVFCVIFPATRPSIVAAAPASFSPSRITGSVTALSAGTNHTCAVRRDGRVYCWGDNSFGQLGTPGIESTLTPLTVDIGDVPAMDIVAGTFHTCAVLRDRTMKCWGANGSGSLGIGDWVNRESPVTTLFEGDRLVELTAFSTVSCGIATGGMAKCWGGNSHGQLGDQTTQSRNTPTVVIGLSGLIGIDAGASHTCAVESDGEVKCWGLNTDGRLGNGSTANSLSPALSHGSARQVSAGGAHTCSVTAAGDAKCWGSGSYGQMGNGLSTSSSSPVNVTFGASAARVMRLSSGHQHTCALHANGAVSCWGRSNYGQAGSESATVASPTFVSLYGPNNPAVDVVAGTWHTCALAADGVVSCWGRNDMGQTADVGLENHSEPRSVAGLDDQLSAPQVAALSESHDSVQIDVSAASELGVRLDLEFSAVVDFTGVTPRRVGPVGPTSLVSVGDQHACAVTVDQVRCWGDNASLQSGTGPLRSDSSRLASHDLSGVVSVSAGKTASCALDAAGRVSCWGRKWGSAVLLDVPDLMALSAPAVTVSAGRDAACAVLVDGALTCWGSGAVVESATPVAIDLGEGVRARDVAVGDTAACAIVESGAVHCWGTGPVGSGDPVTSPSAVTFDDQSPIRARFVDVGSGHACAITDAGDVTCWGANAAGQLGRNSRVASLTAGPLSSGTDTTKWLSLGVGGDMTCGLRASGTMQCWGSGADSIAPTDVAVASSVGVLSGVAVGTTQACAVTTAGNVACWSGGTSITRMMDSSKMVSATVEVTGLSPLTDYFARSVVTRTGQSARSTRVDLLTAPEPTTTTTTSTTTTTTSTTTTTTTTTTTSTTTTTPEPPSSSSSSTTSSSTSSSTTTSTVAATTSTSTTSTTLPPTSVTSSTSSTTTSTVPADEVVWPTVATSSTTLPRDTAPEAPAVAASESKPNEQQAVLAAQPKAPTSVKRPPMVTLSMRQGERLTMSDLARKARVKIPESMVVMTLTASRVESVAAWSDTWARLVVTTVSRCQATLADYVHAAVRANRPGKCLVVLSVQRPDGEKVVRSVTLQVRGITVSPKTARVGKVR